MKTSNKAFYSALLVAILNLMSCSVAPHHSTLESATEAGKDLYVTCHDAHFAANFFGPQGLSADAIDFVELNELVGRDANRLVASVACKRNPNPRTAGSDYITHGCFDAVNRSAGIYSVSLSQDRRGFRQAVLEQVTSRGAQTIAKMTCKSV